MEVMWTGQDDEVSRTKDSDMLIQIWIWIHHVV